MKIIYEQGDIVFNKNNNDYGMVIADFYKDSVKILEISTTAFINDVPRTALTYKGHCNFRKRLLDIVESEVEESEVEK